MNKTLLIIKREYLTRVKKKSFIVMTLLGPILMASIYIVPILLYKYGNEQKQIAMIDEAGLFANGIKPSKTIVISTITKSVNNAKQDLKQEKLDGLLYIPADVFENPQGVMLYSEKQASLDVVEYLENTIQQAIEDKKLMKSGVNRAFLDSIKTDVKVNTFKLTDKGEESGSAGLTTGIGMVFGVLTYMFIFLFGTQVMRGVIEEKTNRIIEVIISSVRPFQLMMGKIVGIAMVGLTQFLLWIILTMAITTYVSGTFLKGKVQAQQEQLQAMKQGNSASAALSKAPTNSGDILEALKNVNIPLIIGAFLFYFLGGYLLYGAWFAAIGSAVDSETDVQQFMLPITIPLVLSFVVSQFVIMNPDGPIAFWFSIIPLTSPVVMMVRLPFGVPVFDLLLSMALLILGFLGTTWLAAKIYRTGILMYGKKPTYKELGKWLFYKE